MFDFRSFTEEQKERILKKFEASFEKKDKKECWIWTGPRWNTGYGRFRITINDKHYELKAHRASWAIYYGAPVPNGLFCCHRCDVRPCINPDHLKIANAQENNIDAVIRGQWRSRWGSAQLPLYKRIDIVRRHINGESGTDLANEFGISDQVLVVWRRSPAIKAIFGDVDLSNRCGKFQRNPQNQGT